MRSIEVSERTVRLSVIVFSLLGVSVLFLIANFTNVTEVELSSLGDHDGELVSTRGIVVGQDIHSSGSSMIQIVENGTIAEVFIERSDQVIMPGTRVKVKGDVFAGSGHFSITMQSDKVLEILEEKEPVPFDQEVSQWSPVFLEGIVVSTQGSGWSEFDLTVIVELAKGPYFLSITATDALLDIRSGDTILFSGLVWNDGSVHCFGDRSMELLYRPESTTSSLLSLLDRLSNSPGDIPTGKMNIRGYLKYEPTSTSLYISDEPEGSSISLKVKIPMKDPLIHKGDLIELINTTFFWDPDGLRYVLITEHVEIITTFGPWYLKMENLEYGLSAYENAEVVISGEVISRYERYILVDGESSIEIRSDIQMPIEVERSFHGVVRSDHYNNTYFLAVLEVID